MGNPEGKVSHTAMYIVLAIVVIGSAMGYYLLVYKPKEVKNS